jgi:peptide/nickel transport system ATP-binding protein/oligopeptide transport system ATP-binding protein
MTSGETENGLLTVTNLHAYFYNDNRVIKAVEGVSFTIKRGEVLGLVGESGSGKTITALSVMRLVPSPGKIVKGSLLFEGRELATLTDSEMQEVRGGKIGMIFQEPLTSLNPVLRIGEQIIESIMVHRRLGEEKAREIAIDLLRKVGFDRPEQRYLQYPHQLSGGQRQRVLIAIAMSCKPSLIIADEPTTALDVSIEGQILRLLGLLRAEYGMSMLFITHNLGIIRRIGDRIGIMYAGRIVEEAPVDDFFHKPMHPYSKGLLDSMPQFAGDAPRLRAIPGTVPRMSEMPEGCKFHPRCPYVMARCREQEPDDTRTGNRGWVRCFLYQN